MGVYDGELSVAPKTLYPTLPTMQLDLSLDALCLANAHTFQISHHQFAMQSPSPSRDDSSDISKVIFSDATELLQSQRHYTTVFSGCVALPLTSKRIMTCKNQLTTPLKDSFAKSFKLKVQL